MRHAQHFALLQLSKQIARFQSGRLGKWRSFNLSFQPDDRFIGRRHRPNCMSNMTCRQSAASKLSTGGFASMAGRAVSRPPSDRGRATAGAIGTSAIRRSQGQVSTPQATAALSEIGRPYRLFHVDLSHPFGHDEAPDRFLHRPANREQAVVAQDAELPVAERRCDALAQSIASVVLPH